jgi:hypothetical protein
MLRNLITTVSILYQAWTCLRRDADLDRRPSHVRSSLAVAWELFAACSFSFPAKAAFKMAPPEDGRRRALAPAGSPLSRYIDAENAVCSIGLYAKRTNE